MQDVRRVWQSGDTIIIAGDRWAIVREQPTGEDAVSQFFIRERYWTPLTNVGIGPDLADPDTMFDLAYTRSAERVGQVADYPDLATVSPTVAEYLVHAPHDAPVERIVWDEKTVLRCWWISTGSAVTTVLVEVQP